MTTLKRKIGQLRATGEEGQAYAYGGGGLLVAVLVIVLLVYLLR